MDINERGITFMSKEKDEQFKPYVPADKTQPELTITSVVMGIILAVVFGAANAYLGLRVGMTVSASIPAAVVSMGVLRILLKRNSVLESNIVQTIGSAGESLAAGIIFTMPVLFLWSSEGVTDKPGMLTIMLIALIGGLLGAVVSALAIGGVLKLLDAAWGFGSAELSAPQATLMKMIIEGVMNGNLPWTLVFIGVFIAVVIEILGIPVLPVAIGLYLPLEMSVPIMIGGVIKYFISKKESKEDAENEAGGGVLFCSGLIAGEGIIGIVLAILAVLGAEGAIDFSGSLNMGNIGGLVVLAILSFGIVCAEKKSGSK